jgi:phospholipid/cholesterol/gamma-HCH transport system substrate-binding protein
MSPRTIKLGVIVALVVTLVGGLLLRWRASDGATRIHVVAYFANSNGIFVGDDVRVLGVTIGKIEKIEPEPQRAKISFWYSNSKRVPANAKAVILAPSLVSVRAIQLTPAYTGGPTMSTGAVIPQDRTAVPVEWDDFRQQLQKLTDTLQPTSPGGVSTLGAFINTTADNLRGQGTSIRDTLTKLSQAFSALGDHSTDIFSTVKNLSTLVSALQGSTDLMRQLNENLGATTALLSNDPNAVGTAIDSINDIVGDVTRFTADNRDALGSTSDKLASVTTAVNQSLDDLKETLHLTPTAFQNFVNIYQPSQGALTGTMVVNNFANPIQFLCGAIQAASRLGAEQAAKLCVQYLAPIVKNRQYNFPPLGENLFVGQMARPNELTYSEDWLRPDYVPPASTAPAPPAGAPVTPNLNPPLAAEAQSTDPQSGLKGMMTPPTGGTP